MMISFQENKVQNGKIVNEEIRVEVEGENQEMMSKM